MKQLKAIHDLFRFEDDLSRNGAKIFRNETCTGIRQNTLRLAAPSSPISSSLYEGIAYPTLCYIVLFHRLSSVIYARLAYSLRYTLAMPYKHPIIIPIIQEDLFG